MTDMATKSASVVSGSPGGRAYQEYVNLQWVALLNIVMRMFHEKNILTQICGNNFMMQKAAPPLVVSEEQLDEFVVAIRDVVELADTSAAFWTEALNLARRAVNI